MQYYKRIQDAVDYIEKHLTQSIEIQKVSEQACFSPFYFQRLFRIISGYSVYEYIMKRRMSESCHLLRETDLSILEIAVSFDYSSHEAFSRAFSKCFGIKPSEFRRNKNQKVERVQKLLINEFMSNFPDYHLDEPVIKRMSRKIVYGYAYRTNLNSDKYFKEIPLFYDDFGKRALFLKIPERVSPAISYGIPCDYNQNGDFSFLVGEETAHCFDDFDEGFKLLELPEGEYAEFSIHGSVTECQKAWKYIYLVWLPKSIYEKADSPDYEMTDVCHSQYPDNMKIKILIPLIKRNTLITQWNGSVGRYINSL